MKIRYLILFLFVWFLATSSIIVHEVVHVMQVGWSEVSQVCFLGYDHQNIECFLNDDLNKSGSAGGWVYSMKWNEYEKGHSNPEISAYFFQVVYIIIAFILFFSFA